VCQTTAGSSLNRPEIRHQTQPPVAGDAGPPHALLLRESAPAVPRELGPASALPTAEVLRETGPPGPCPAGPNEGGRAHWSLARGQDAGLYILKHPAVFSGASGG